MKIGKSPINQIDYSNSHNDAVDSIFYSIGVPYNKLFLDFNPKGCGIIEEIKDIFTKINNKNNMKNLKITAPKGYEIDKANSTFENIVFKPIKKELPKSWEELEEITGYFISGFGGITKETNLFCDRQNLSTQLFATKEQAEASLALAQLSQLREVYRDGWKPEDGKERYIIIFQNNKIVKDWAKSYGYFLSFRSAEVRDLFLENFRDLIEQAKPLMS